MQIRKNPIIRTYSRVSIMFRWLVLTSVSLALILSGGMLSQSLLKNQPNALALGEPAAEACFATTSTTEATITAYHTNENNDVAQPACPRDVVIPSSIAGIPVTRIGTGAFQARSLTSVVIPEGVRVIEHSGFRSNQITTATFPSTLTDFGISGFRDNQLTSITIPSGMNTIATSSFRGNRLAALVIPEGVTTVGNDAFLYNQLTSVSLPNSLVNLGSSVFEYNNLTQVDLPDNLTIIRNYTFANNSLTSVDIPAGVTVIEFRAFWYNDLSLVNIPDGVTTIGDRAFYGNLLTSIDLPSNLVTIGAYAFGYNSLTSVSLPNSVTTIGANSFERNELESVTLSNSLTSIPNYAFSYNKLTTVTIPSSVTAIGDSAFSSNTLEAVDIPASVNSIGNNAFASNSLTTASIGNPGAILQHTVFSRNPLQSLEIGVSTYSAQTTTTEPACFLITDNEIKDYYSLSPLIARDNGVLCGSSIGIPSGTVSIGASALSNKQLTSVTIPNTVTNLADYALSDNHLASVTIPNSIASIGASALAGNQLTSVSLPDTVATLGGYALSNNKLTSVSIPRGISTIEAGVFYANQLESVTVPSNITSIGSSAFSSNKISNVQLSEGLTAIGSQAFFSNKITALALPNSLQTIGEWAFQYNELASLDLPNSLVSIGKYAFSLNKITSVQLPNNITTLTEGVFWKNNMSTVDIPASVTAIEHATFQENSLQTVYIYGNPSLQSGSFGLNGLDRSTVPEEAQSGLARNEYYHANAVMVRIYSDNQAFIDAQPATFFTNHTADGRAITASGRIINPANIQVLHQTKQGGLISPSSTFISSDVNVADYKIAQFVDTSDPALHKIRVSKTSLLYRIGSEANLVPVAISGYISPNAQLMILPQHANSHTFIYKPMIFDVAFKSTTVVDNEREPESLPQSINYTLITDSKLSLPKDSVCQTISQAQVLSPEALQTSTDADAVVADDITIVGGLNFALDYCEDGGVTDITYELGDNIVDTTSLRVYKHDPLANKIEDMTELVTFSESPTGKTTLNYKIEDGGKLDQDGIINGKIVDPIYIGLPASLLQQPTLAATGASFGPVFVGGVSLALLGTTGITMLRRGR